MDATVPGRSQALEARHKKSRAALGYLGTVEDRRIRLYDVQAWVNGLAAKYAPGTVAQYLGPVRQALDHAELERPNPARDPRLRLPSMSSEEHEPPSFRAFLRIGGAIGERHRLPLLFMERHGLRIGELHKLVWGDVDLRGRRLRISRGRTKRGTGGERWIPLPAGWAEHLDRLTPIQGRGPDVRVFADFNPRRSGPP